MPEENRAACLWALPEALWRNKASRMDVLAEKLAQLNKVGTRW